MNENITVTGGTLEQSEIENYIHHVQSKDPDRHLKYLEIEVDGDFVNLKYEFDSVPFERIRRITGYLVGDTSRWNNAKKSELGDRTKHDMAQ
jgi:hypothetical protein